VKLALSALLGVLLLCYGQGVEAQPHLETEVESRGTLSRLTYYHWTGSPTASGLWPAVGLAACSWNYPMGTQLRLSNGVNSVDVVCADRGHLGGCCWIDVYAPTRAYGEWFSWTFGFQQSDGWHATYVTVIGYGY
jgi:hypothetical protein